MLGSFLVGGRARQQLISAKTWMTMLGMWHTLTVHQKEQFAEKRLKRLDVYGEFPPFIPVPPRLAPGN